MKCIDTLLNCNHDKKCGNHALRFTPTSRKFYYNRTVICEINYHTKTVIIDDGKIGGTSITRAINYYLKHQVIDNLISQHEFTLIDLRR